MIYSSILGTDGKPSSKKITAYVLTLLICILVFFLIGIDIYVFVKKLKLKEDYLELIDLTKGTILWLMGGLLALNGIAGWQQVSNNKILNPGPAENKTVIQTGSPAITVEENKPE